MQNYTPTTSFLNPIYNISQLLQVTKYFSHPSVYPLLHTKQLSLNYTLFNTSTNHVYTAHHKAINQLLQSPPVSNSNFSAPPLALQLQAQAAHQPLQPSPIAVPPGFQPQAPAPQPQAPAVEQAFPAVPQETPPIS